MLRGAGACSLQVQLQVQVAGAMRAARQQSSLAKLAEKGLKNQNLMA